MSSERFIVVAYLLTLKEPELSFEHALQIVEKEFKEQEAFVREDICFIGLENETKKEKCIGCEKDKIVYGNETIKFCAECMLPKNIYQKYIKTEPQIVFRKEDPELLNSLQQQILLLSKK